jgi:hypothetical protein
MAMASQRRGDQYPLPSYQPWQHREDDMRTFTFFLEDAKRRRRQVVEDRQRRRLLAKNRRSDAGAGPSGDGTSPSGA